jgi:hypothetical protein
VSKRTAKPKRLRGWDQWPKEKLLDTRICDLGLRIKSSPLQPLVDKLYQEFDYRRLDFRPHIWLSDEWFSPDGVPGFAIPFYLAHPRLKRLEREMVLEVEGGTRNWCMKLLRHEAGHALLNAYQLDQRPDWRKLFGRPNAKYPDSYLPKPYSKRFVVHLPNWYAQSHPHEDWAETFAVWLKPHSDWRKRYRKWPAMRKLEYVNELMQDLRAQKPRIRNRRQELPLEKLKMTLREYYEEKVGRYGSYSPEFFDVDLTRLFSNKPEHTANMSASRFIRRYRRHVLDTVERWTGEYKYRINEVLKEMILRCDKMALHISLDEELMLQEVIACTTMIVMNKLYNKGFHISL